MVLDYSKVCGACSQPLGSPPRDGADSICALLHTDQGRAMFERTLKRNLKRQKVVNEATLEATVSPNEATIDREATVTPDEATPESRSQRHKRLNRERINQQQRDRRA